MTNVNDDADVKLRYVLSLYPQHHPEKQFGSSTVVHDHNALRYIFHTVAEMNLPVIPFLFIV